MAQFVRAALGDIWKCNSTWHGYLQSIRSDLTVSDPTETGGWILYCSTEVWDKQPSGKFPLVTSGYSRQGNWNVTHLQGTPTVNLSPEDSDSKNGGGDNTTEKNLKQAIEDAYAVYEEKKRNAAGSLAEFPYFYQFAPNGSSPVPFHTFEGHRVEANFEASGGDAPPEGGSGKPKETDSSRALWSVEAPGGWPPAFSLVPTKGSIETAIRLVDIGKLVQQSKYVAGVLGGEGNQKHIDELLGGTSENPQGVSQEDASAETKLRAYPLEFIWKVLPADERAPLEAFFLSKTDVSRGVFLIDRKWFEEPEQSGIQDIQTPLGFMVVKRSREDWRAWYSGCVAVHGEEKQWQIEIPRFEFDLQEPKDGERSEDQYFAVEIPLSLGSMLKPSLRPARELLAPCALVTTTDYPVYYPKNKIPDIVRPIWQIQGYKGSHQDGQGKKYRLVEAQGYEWPEDWVRKAKRNFLEKRPKGDRRGGADVSLDSEAEYEETLRAIDWMLSRYHRHGNFVPQWVPDDLIEDRGEFENLVISDLDFGFRRFGNFSSEEAGAEIGDSKSGTRKFTGEEFQNLFSNFIIKEESKQPDLVTFGIRSDVSYSGGEALSYPDWWWPLLKWSVRRLNAKLKSKDPATPDHFNGWIVAILGRQLPVTETEWCEGCDVWDQNDLWYLLRNASRSLEEGGEKAPLFRDRTVVVVSANLLRASGARISHRLSWEQAAVNCIQALEGDPRFSPLLEFRHLVVRFGCTGAILVTRQEATPWNDVVSKNQTEQRTYRLFYDATAKGGFHRDLTADGQVVGANSVFAACILEMLLRGSEKNGCRDSDKLVGEGISKALDICQELYDKGYGDSFKEHDPYRLNYFDPDSLLSRSSFR